MQVVHERCAGLDVHKKNVYGCILVLASRDAFGGDGGISPEEEHRFDEARPRFGTRHGCSLRYFASSKSRTFTPDFAIMMLSPVPFPQEGTAAILPGRAALPHCGLMYTIVNQIGRRSVLWGISGRTS
jgi:hypothetical protein